jgi:N-acetylmuramic acid 6-phosphate etherase
LTRKGKVKHNNTELSQLSTEQPNSSAKDLDLKSPLKIARIINNEDAKVAAAVKRVLPQIAQAIDVIASALRNGGRLIYVGTGTSGRIAALDAVECPPTFNTSPRTVQFVIAGGVRALAAAVESNEDSGRLGELAIAKKKPGKNDVVVGIAASGRTPFTIAAVAYARRKGAQTIAVTCNRGSRLGQAAEIEIVVEVGSEVISGSTRMKAGTAQKMVLNMLSSGAMTLLGYVYGNLMVNVRTKNVKLAERAVTILRRATGIDRKAAHKALAGANNSVPLALVMLKTQTSEAEARRALQAAGGHVRDAIAATTRRG